MTAERREQARREGDLRAAGRAHEDALAAWGAAVTVGDAAAQRIAAVARDAAREAMDRAYRANEAAVTS